MKICARVIDRLSRQPSHQAGYATLSIAAILLVVLTLMTLYLSKSGILDIRTSANRARYAESLSNAERNLNVGLGWLSVSANRNPATFTPSTWSACNATAFNGYKVQQGLGANWACLIQSATYSTGANAVANFVIATPVGAASQSVFLVVAEGTSDDGTANAVVRQGVYFFASTGGSNAPPLMGTGNIPLNGSYTVVPNPNAGGNGVAVSVWSQTTIDPLSGSAATCQLGEYLLAGNTCTASATISSKDGKGSDIVDNDANFPTDVFQYIFGVPTSQYPSIKSQATVVADCSAASLAGKSGIVWVSGACDIPAGTTVGSDTSPVQLVVENGDFTMRANSTFYGQLFALGTAGPSYNAGDISANGGAKFYGSMVSNDATSMGVIINGTFDIVYNQKVSDALSGANGNTQFKRMVKLPGGWADFL